MARNSGCRDDRGFIGARCGSSREESMNKIQFRMFLE
jgi:hypothetical protein